VDEDFGLEALGLASTAYERSVLDTWQMDDAVDRADADAEAEAKVAKRKRSKTAIERRRAQWRRSAKKKWRAKKAAKALLAKLRAA
jgi:hypothetical protein